MTEHRSAYGTPLDQSGPHPDPWHDRARWTPPLWFWVALAFGAVAWAVVS